MILTERSTMDNMYHSSDGESGAAVKKSSNSAAYEMIPLDDKFEPTSLDVICARGKEAYNHPGNIRFRALVADQLHNYKTSTSKMAKSQIVRDIIESVRRASPRGGFVKKVNGKWFDVGERARREKTGQQIRDLLHESYKSSTKSKALTRKRLRKSLSTNTTVVKDFKGAFKGAFPSTAATGGPGQSSIFANRRSGLPPKMVSLDSQSSDAAAISAMALQNDFHRRSSMGNSLSNLNEIPMPSLRRGSVPAGLTNAEDLNESMTGLGMSSHNNNVMNSMSMSMSMGGLHSSMGGGMDAPAIIGMGGSSSTATTAMNSMSSSMSSSGAGASIMGSNMGMGMGMNSMSNMAASSSNNMNFSSNTHNNNSSMNVIGNMSQSSTHNPWDFGRQQETLLQQQQQLLHLQQEQQRLQEQQRELTELMQRRSVPIPPSIGGAAAGSQGAFSSSQSFMNYGGNMSSSQFDMNASSASHHSSSGASNMGSRSRMSSQSFAPRNSRPQISMTDMYRGSGDRMDRLTTAATGHGEPGFDPLPVDVDSHLYAEQQRQQQQQQQPNPAAPEVSFEDAIDNICHVDEMQRKRGYGYSTSKRQP